MTERVLVTVAMESELDLQRLNSLQDRNFDVLTVGVGMFNVFASGVVDALRHGSYTKVINVGTAGAARALEKGKIYQVDRVSVPRSSKPVINALLNHRDIDLDILESADVEVAQCVSCYDFADVIVNPNRILYDMELYALAMICLQYGCKLSSFKYVSDDGAVEVWEASMARASSVLTDFLVKELM